MSACDSIQHKYNWLLRLTSISFISSSLWYCNTAPHSTDTGFPEDSVLYYIQFFLYTNHLLAVIHKTLYFHMSLNFPAVILLPAKLYFVYFTLNKYHHTTLILKMSHTQQDRSQSLQTLSHIFMVELLRNHILRISKVAIQILKLFVSPEDISLVNTLSCLTKLQWACSGILHLN